MSTKRQTINIHRQIGWVVVEKGNVQRAYSHSYCSWRGNTTSLDRNSLGQLCMSSLKKPAVWKTRKGAERKCQEVNDFFERHGNTGNLRESRVVELYPTNNDMRDAIRQTFNCADQAGREAIIRVVQAVADQHNVMLPGDK